MTHFKCFLALDFCDLYHILLLTELPLTFLIEYAYWQFPWFLFFWVSFISDWLLKDICIEYSLRLWLFSLLSILTILSSVLFLTWFLRKSLLNFMLVFLYMMTFSLVYSRFSLYLFQQFEYNINGLLFNINLAFYSLKFLELWFDMSVILAIFLTLFLQISLVPHFVSVVW